MRVGGPLPNRATPFGDAVADPVRGLFMGNRGGRIHDPETRRPTGRIWASRRWITCLTAFRGRRREVWGRSYTELFFLDEPTAFAAGHRPCAECRREAVRRFLAALGRTGTPLDEVDRALHAERRDGRAQRRWRGRAEALPDGVMIAQDGRAYAIRGDAMLPWSHAGYGPALPRRAGDVEVLTPPTLVGALAGGYAPVWHPTADL